MGLNIKSEEVNALVTQVARATGVSKTEAIRLALLEQQRRLGLPSVETRLQLAIERLERDVWSKLPPEFRGKGVTKEEYDALFE